MKIKSLTYIIFGMVFSLSGFSAEPLKVGEGNILQFISRELKKLGGKTNNLEQFTIEGTWQYNRDSMGVAINLKRGKYESLTNALSKEFGAPLTYIKANNQDSATFLYPWNRVGVSIYVKETTNWTEITLTKPIK
jgi:hypothetical protein